jgi:hypothetical protein
MLERYAGWLLSGGWSGTGAVSSIEIHLSLLLVDVPLVGENWDLHRLADYHAAACEFNPLKDNRN